jgi:2-succinyl-5-enolpyruvyl-6-hydroxy-3-cyclohexene-1-carboxylate synthase
MTSNLHTAWARLFVNALVASGVRDIVVSPGSRSTPLTLAAAQHPSLRIHVHVDERVAGFFALGQARSTARPTVLFCTSGTAGAHWIPAAIEASLTGVPLVCVTADRPWEAYDCASPQTIDQVHLLGHHARHYADLGAPDAAVNALRAVGRIASQSVHRSQWPSPGAVHINARFRKPLEPITPTTPEPWEPLVQSLLQQGPTRTFHPSGTPAPEAVQLLCDALKSASSPWIVCGPTLTHTPAEITALREAVFELCITTGAILLAEATSNFRYGVPTNVRAVSLFDTLLRSPTLRAHAKPDVIIEIGFPPTSPTYASFVSENSFQRFVLAPHGWPDPHGNATAMIYSEAVPLLRALVASQPLVRTPSESPLLEAQTKAATVVTHEVNRDVFHEGVLAHALVSTLPEHSVLCVGNSLPVRDLDMFTHGKQSNIRVTHQRGASGIDGIIAGAAGTRTVTSSDHPVVAYLGDISALHDLGGLNAVRIAGETLAIVIVNNHGGRIFEQLPLGRQSTASATEKDQFERLFTTPQHVSFEHAAAAFHLHYLRVSSRTEFEHALTQCFERKTPYVIEAIVTPESGRATRDRIHATVLGAVG